jgi:hypothetical protein
VPDPGPKPTGIAARRWLSWAAILVLIPYVIVWGKTDSFNYAFEVLTGTGHPFNNGAGPVAAILALEGYLLVPVAVGAVASAWFMISVRRTYGDEQVKQVADDVRKDLS